MLKGFLSAIFGAGFSVAVTAMPASAADDIAAKVQPCAACHGENGVSADPRTIPTIWGQQQSYLVKQLHDFRSGDRASPIFARSRHISRPSAGRRKPPPPRPRRPAG
jgi:cytochrome c553